ncbi:MAG TPA: hypothetical protein VFV98_20815 [Vicinamibacterales bacterium]|nr:hypothetical protein [Vicinamibacterales bacterium]
MAKRLIDSVTGIGSLQAGNLTLRATRYRLSFWVNDDLPQSNDLAAATVDGHIDISGIGEAAVLSGPETLTLTLADGREIAVKIKSTAGEIVGRCL